MRIRIVLRRKLGRHHGRPARYRPRDPFFFADEIVRRGAARNGFTWHYNRPPVVEMDCRRVHVEHALEA